MQNSKLDIDIVEELRSLDDGAGEILREIVDIFEESTKETLDELRRAQSENDVEAFTRSAHSLKGSSANLGATGLAKLARGLEDSGCQNALSNTPASLKVAEAEFLDVMSRLRKLV